MTKILNALELPLIIALVLMLTAFIVIMSVIFGGAFLMICILGLGLGYSLASAYELATH